MKARVTCARCYRERYADRMTSIPGRVPDEAVVFVCIARGSCRVARKAHRRTQSPTIKEPDMSFRVTAHPFPGEGEPTVRDHDTIGDAVDHLADLAVDVEGGVTARIELEETPR